MPEEPNKKPQIDPARSISGSFPANSKKSKTEAEPEVKKVTPIEGMVVTVKKPPMMSRLREAFTGENSTSIGEYLLLQVVVPTVKNLIYDVITGGANRALFGSSFNPQQQQQGGNSRGTGNVAYNQMSRAVVVGKPNQAGMSSTDKARHNFNNIIFGTRREAEQVLSEMLSLIARYDVAVLTDLYEMVNITGNFADDQFGWFNLDGADIQPARGGGFSIIFPPTQPIR